MWLIAIDIYRRFLPSLIIDSFTELGWAENSMIGHNFGRVNSVPHQNEKFPGFHNLVEISREYPEK